jgi:hypothetical protein
MMGKPVFSALDARARIAELEAERDTALRKATESGAKLAERELEDDRNCHDYIAHLRSFARQALSGGDAADAAARMALRITELEDAIRELKRQDRDAYIAGGEWHPPFHDALAKVLALVSGGDEDG